MCATWPPTPRSSPTSTLRASPIARCSSPPPGVPRAADAMERALTAGAEPWWAWPARSSRIPTCRSRSWPAGGRGAAVRRVQRGLPHLRADVASGQPGAGAAGERSAPGRAPGPSARPALAGAGTTWVSSAPVQRGSSARSRSPERGRRGRRLERETDVGGAWPAAAAAPHRHGWLALLDYTRSAAADGRDAADRRGGHWPRIFRVRRGRRGCGAEECSRLPAMPASRPPPPPPRRRCPPAARRGHPSSWTTGSVGGPL